MVLGITLSYHAYGVPGGSILVVEIDDEIHSHDIAQDSGTLSQRHETAPFFALQPGITVDPYY